MSSQHEKMLKINLKSNIEHDFKSVLERFDGDLFRYLLPPRAELIEFGGSKQGDKVHLKLPIAGEWISEITEDTISDDFFYFIDEGRKLPFPLKKWHHRHVLRKNGPKTIVEDIMSFSTGTIITDLFFYPVLYLSFLPRVWQYGKYFKSLDK